MSRAFGAIGSVSVLVPTWQGEEFLDRLLAALAAQRFALPWDVHVIDSGSTDRTIAILDAAREDFSIPLTVRGIHQVEFDHGDTRNLLAAWSTGDLLVYLTQDAIPGGQDWLAKLVANFDDPLVAAVTCRNVPRADADPLTKVLCVDDPGYGGERREVRLPPADEYERLSPHEKRLLYNFNDVASAIRRAAWELHPFPRTPFGEDVLMARGLLEAGWTVVHDTEAVVEHSHDYDAAQTRARAEVDGRFNAEWLDRVGVASRSDARTLTKRLAARDAEVIRAQGHTGEAARELERRAGELRAAAFEGMFEGGRAERRRPATRALESGELHVLYVVHGFPPDTWAGTEIYTLNLAREMQRLGHRCTVLARVPAPENAPSDDPPDFSVEETTFEGLRVLRLTHRLAHASLRESYAQPKAERAFRAVLRAERPDVVHFQHLIHTSVGLVDVARDAGLPTIVHCHDYWAICARVQLIRPDGVRCPENMGAGCFLCVKDQHLEHVPRLKKLGRLAGPLLDALASGARRLGSARSKRRWEGFADLADRQEVVVGAYAAADLRVSPSRFLRALLVDTAGFEPESFLYSENGMRTDHVEALAKRPDPAGRVRFGFVGSLVWYKGADVLLRALARLVEEGKDQGVAVLFFGAFDPEHDPHHRELADLAAPLGDRVEFRGRFDNARLSEVYAEVDVLVVPSVWVENAPITIREALLTRTPTLCSDVGGMAESVRDGVDGLHFAVGDPGALAAAMRRLADEPELRARLASDPPRIKTIAENALETEFRYRALACVVREAGGEGGGTLLDHPGIATLARMGPVNEQGADLLLLRGAGAAVEYDLEPAGGGPREVRVDVRALGGESGVELGGRVLVDEAPLGFLDPFRAGERDETRSFALRAVLPEGARRLRLDGRTEDGRELFLRVARVVVRGLPEDDLTGDPA